MTADVAVDDGVAVINTANQATNVGFTADVHQLTVQTDIAEGCPFGITEQTDVAGCCAADIQVTDGVTITFKDGGKWCGGGDTNRQPAITVVIEVIAGVNDAVLIAIKIEISSQFITVTAAVERATCSNAVQAGAIQVITHVIECCQSGDFDQAIAISIDSVRG